MKFLSTIRFDPSDVNTFDVAAQPGTWAISGAFAFAGMEATRLMGKRRQAFANGFLGLEGFGRSTFASVAEISEEEFRFITHALANHLSENYGAPSNDAALSAASEEINFVQELVADALINTIFTVHRKFDADGQIIESFRTIQPPGDKPLHSKIWAVVDD